MSIQGDGVGGSVVSEIPASGALSRLRLGWGKLRRFYYCLCRPGYVRQQAAIRQGECRRCGACCVLMFRCPLLKNGDSVATCLQHHHRPVNCRVFPLDERDLRDRDLVLPDQSCGFHFPSMKP